ncbi:SurA N-terminal domain-containing protein [Actinophytocola xanthii]|uniref:PpiC domain-containing protein n=1 Tax=Actinophytocola xanthii TaxID=1912961 RepID=A0A1Q8CLP2_9PSEU|nr:SurA N-terminal domain-containing protein [Actinophytocola xanthii]OLF15275.1 hypothetical protein BU204_22680 [Actinophytocola xanthii]
MTTAKFRRHGVLAVLTALVATLTACGSGPSRVNSAVIVDGSTSISVDTVQGLVEKVVREQPAARPLAQQRKLDLVAREAVSQLVVHELITDAAREEDITVSREELSRALSGNPFGDELPDDGSVPPEALASQLVYRARDQREAVIDQLLLAQLAAKYYQRLQITMDFTVISGDQTGGDPSSMREQAEDKARQFAADPDKVGDLIAKDTEAGVNASEGAEFAALQDPALASTVMFGAEEGSVVAFEPSPGQALWVVGLIRSRDTDASPEVAEQPQVEPEQLVAIGRRFLQPYAEETSIEVSPRYGVWDLAAMGVAPSDDETVGLVLTPENASQ